MAIYFVDSGRADDTGSGLTWALAKKTLAAALALATGDTDIVVVKSTHQENFSADTILTFAGNIRLITATADDTGTAYTPAAMGTGGWVGNDTTNYYVRFAGTDKRVHVWGLTVRTSGSTADLIGFGNTSSGTNQVWENCYFWAGNTAANLGALEIGLGGYGVFRFIDCILRFGATTQFVVVGGHAEFIDCTISADGSTPSTLFNSASAWNRADVKCIGCDWQLITGTLVGNIEGRADFHFDRCKFGSGVTVLGAQTTNPTEDSASVFVSDCFNDSTDLKFGYYNALGSVVLDTGIYYTTTDAKLIGTDDAPDPVSWKIVTNSNVKLGVPFITPWIDLYHSGTSQITPRLEILRDGNSTAFTDAEVWAETLAKVTADSTKASYYEDFAGIGVSGSAQANGAGLGSWTGETTTGAPDAWSGKIDSGAALTPAEPGYISMRVCVGASITVYVDPQIRID